MISIYRGNNMNDVILKKYKEKEMVNPNVVVKNM